MDIVTSLGFERPAALPHLQYLVDIEGFTAADRPGPLRAILRRLTTTMRDRLASEPRNALHIAAHHGATSCAVLLASEPPVFPLHLEMPGHGRALHIAAHAGHISIVEYLLTFDPSDSGLSRPAVTASGRMAIHYAAMGGNLDVVKCLAVAGEAIDAPDTDRRSPLLHAVMNGHIHVAQYLLSTQNVEIDRSDAKQMCALYYAILVGRGDLLTLLLESGASPMNPQCYRDGLQYLATLDGMSDAEAERIAKVLVVGGADPSARTASQNTAYHMAVRHRKHLLAAYLLPLTKLGAGTYLPPAPAL